MKKSKMEAVSHLPENEIVLDRSQYEVLLQAKNAWEIFLITEKGAAGIELYVRKTMGRYDNVA